jgi:hypothetical protein
MFNAKVIQIIRADLELRGNGVDDPYRRITQYWTLDGRLLWEEDPCRGLGEADGRDDQD